MPLYKQPKSSIWWINLSHQGERIRESTGTDDRVEAQRIHDRRKAELWDRPTIKGRTWGQAVMLWAEAGPRSESDLLSLRKFAKHFRDRALTDVTREAVHVALGFCKTPATYMRYRAIIAAVLNLAKEEKWLREVPSLTTKRVEPKTREWITHEQWIRLYAELPTHLKAPAQFAVNTGLRQANVFGLKWADVDLGRRAAFIEAPDTKARKALSVPLNNEAVKALYAVEGQHDEFVFTYRGRPIVKPKAGFNDACTRAGVPGFSWHGFRHTWATWHIQNGTPLEVLQKLGGWSDLRMVMNYAHHSPGYLSQYAGNVNRESTSRTKEGPSA